MPDVSTLFGSFPLLDMLKNFWNQSGVLFGALLGLYFLFLFVKVLIRKVRLATDTTESRSDIRRRCRLYRRWVTDEDYEKSWSDAKAESYESEFKVGPRRRNGGF